ncbi:serine/arginine repetitive matrix protein 1-like [Triticum dicoccoides]|uniref:serine/arginine repetitive matrix protein 1-like n=1 Tax=Triticum dicoccoides TaxID=85692 RepID=UPI00189044BD|nr:serine/arginine repetitive matrix protein 1-like [Triticum dicoccoides]
MFWPPTPTPTPTCPPPFGRRRCAPLSPSDSLASVSAGPAPPPTSVLVNDGGAAAAAAAVRTFPPPRRRRDPEAPAHRQRQGPPPPKRSRDPPTRPPPLLLHSRPRLVPPRRGWGSPLRRVRLDSSCSSLPSPLAKAPRRVSRSHSLRRPPRGSSGSSDSRSSSLPSPKSRKKETRDVCCSSRWNQPLWMKNLFLGS